MTVRSANQLTLDFEPGLTAKYPTLLHCVSAVIQARPPLKTVAADLDCSPSILSRKISTAADQDPDQKRVFNVDDLERYIQHYQDITPVLYLVEKYLQDDATRQRQALAQLEHAIPDLIALVRAAKGGK